MLLWYTFYMENTELKNPQYSYRIPVQYLLEDKTVIAVCPILDVSAYGNNLQEAEANFKLALQAFFEETVEHNRMDEVLKEHGWKQIVVDHKPRWNPPEVIKSDYLTYQA